MTSKQIEEIAVYNVGLYFSYSNTISPYISNNDKEPCWDGNLYVYTDDKKDVASLLGRIPVQVKGKSVKEISDKVSVKYKVNLVNLQNYMRDGGIAYFVVMICNTKIQIYYAKLTPLRLKKYIKQCGGNDSVSIVLDRLDVYSTQIDFEFRDFYFDCKKQTGNTDKTVELKDLVASKKKVEVTFFASGLNSQKQTVSQYLATHRVYLYVKTTDNHSVSSLRPIGDDQYKLNVIEKVKSDITVDGNVYYHEFSRQQLEDGGFVIGIGDCMQIEFTANPGKNANVKFNLKEKELTSWINDAEFILSLINKRAFSINETILKIESNEDNKFIEWCSAKLYRAKQINNVLRLLHTNKNLVLKEFSSQEDQIINTLVQSLLEQKEVSIKEDLPPVFTVQLSNLCLALSAKKTPSGKYLVNSYKSIGDSVYYTDSTTDTLLETSIYSWFQLAGFKDVSNIDYDDILPSYQNVLCKNASITQRANNDMLIMLLAYDENKDKGLLTAAHKISDWLLEQSTDKDKDIFFVNQMQIIKRERLFNEEEKELIMEKIDSIELMGKIACCLLLDNKEMAKHYYKKLDDNQKQFFDTLPIHHFF